MTVQELARRANLPSHVVRYYSQRGLLHPRRDHSNGYRAYSDGDLDRLRFIRRAKAVGLTLSDIEAILEDVDRGVMPCRKIRRLVRSRVDEIDRKIARLRALRRAMTDALELWAQLPGTKVHGRGSPCPLIDAIPSPDERKPGARSGRELDFGGA